MQPPVVSAASDPYYVAREEVQKAVTALQEKARRWEDMYIGNTFKAGGFFDLHKAIGKEAAQAELDLKQIDNAIKAVERNPQRFPHCTPYELDQRRQWLLTAQGKVKAIADRITSPAVGAKLEQDRRKTDQEKAEHDRQRRQEEQNNEGKIERAQQSHRQIIARQDQDLTDLARATSRLGEAAVTINHELQDQQRMLNELDREVDRQTEKMSYVTRKTAQLLQTSDTKQIYMIFCLTALCVVLFLINIYF